MELGPEKECQIKQYRPEILARHANEQEQLNAATATASHVNERAGDSVPDRCFLLGGIAIVILAVVLLVARSFPVNAEGSDAADPFPGLQGRSK
jgi:hypothetical protein